MHAGSEAGSWRFSAYGLYRQSEGIDITAFREHLYNVY